MLSHYYTVIEYGEHEIIVQKSRFICHIGRVTSEEEAQSFIEKIKKKHRQANHNCFAYLIGEQNHIQKTSDDGEPTGTAGVPMLEVLKKKHLHDTVVVVTRYFGGIKLGAGGLIRAYGSAVSAALDTLGVVKRSLMRTIRMTIDYPLLGVVENALHSQNIIINNIDYQESVCIEIFIPEIDKESFKTWIIDKTNGKSVINEGMLNYTEEICKTEGEHK
ncbi:YigZ family protein [Bacillus carboniphilus]|uniref:YigZ family protein n=1 Tax=Bacillus carboniphilus TaxID=86663 RepID=A0ABY9JRY0_9BACI|nr:YigZ family protein [Bacillus carboniphilus]WLR41498.1 YigZ family protein [Bacillus carboniphilus]